MKPNPVWLVPPIAIGGAAVLPGLGLASPFTADPEVRWFDGDGFWNYDYRNRDNQADGDNVDWPVNMVWGKQGQIDDVKTFLANRGWGGSGASQDARLYENGNSGWQWDGDSGIKSPCESYENDPLRNMSGERWMHTRLYAPPPGTGEPRQDQFYSTTWGYYIIGTTHYDYGHGNIIQGCDNGEEWFGNSEEVEGRITSLASAAGCPTYTSTSGPYMNNQGYGVYTHLSDFHYHESDGYATRIDFTPNSSCK